MTTAAAVTITQGGAAPPPSAPCPPAFEEARSRALRDRPAELRPAELRPDELGPEELRAWRGLLRTHAAIARLLDAELERRHGLPMTSYEVLHRLDESELGRMRMCDLAEQAQMSRSGLTRLVDRLERDGLLERCSCEHDARGAYACLTGAGREKLCAARSTHRAVVREHFLSRFSSEELGTLAALWDRIDPCCSCCNGSGSR